MTTLLDTKTSFQEFSGLLHTNSGGTFMRLPRLAADTEILKQAGVTVGILGFPWDAMCISRTGTNYGPRAIREATDQFSFFNANREIDLLKHYVMADCGDVEVVPGSAERTMARAEAMMSAILGSGAMPVTMGGDHSITIAAVRAFRKAHKNPGLILVDSHFDTAVDVGGETLSHCCPITRAVDAGFDPRRIVIVGTNGWMNPQSELDYIRAHGITLFPIEEIWEQGPVAIARKAAAVAGDGTDAAYLTFDIDSIDGAYAPGTGVPAPGGMTSREALALVSEIAKHGIGGLDLVEVSPAYDHDGITSRIAVQLILEALASNAEAKA